MSALIKTDELASKLTAPDMKIIDASWYMPAEGRSAQGEYSQSHIPGAVFFDIDAVCDKNSRFPHMLPDERAFAGALGALGISNSDEVVVYDGSGLFSAPRVWWMLRYFGHSNVKVLDGGLPKWVAEGRITQSVIPRALESSFTTQVQSGLLRNMQDVENNLWQQSERIVDARSPGRFNGGEPEPRIGLRSGNIPGSVNVFFKDCLAPPYNTLKPAGELREVFAGQGVNISMPIVTSCGSGVTACILALALYELGNTSVAVYDGAWAEWGSQKV